MQIQNVIDPFTIVQQNNNTYRGDESDQTYQISPVLTNANSNITIIDQGGVNTIELVGGLTIASSIVTSDETQLTLSNGAVINVRGADTFNFSVGGNTAAGVVGEIKTFAQFAQDVLGVTVPAAGEPAVDGGTVTIDGGTGPVDPEEPTDGETFTLTEALAKLAAADEQVAESEEALVKVLVDAGILDSADNFDSKELDTYVAGAETAVQQATADLATERAKEDGSDAALQKAIADAQAAINANKPADDANAATVRYDAQGELLEVLYAKDGIFVTKDTSGATVAGYLAKGKDAPKTTTTTESGDTESGDTEIGDKVKDFEHFESTVFTARQLQSRADSAKAAVDANIAAKGETFDLATQLNAELGKALGAGTLDLSDSNITGALEAFNAYKAAEANADADDVAKAKAMKVWWDAMSDVVVDDVRGGKEGEPRYVLDWQENSPLAENAVLKELIETFVARGNLEFTAAEREIAFNGGSEVTKALWSTEPDEQIKAPASPVGEDLMDAEGKWEEREVLIDALNEAKANQEALNEAITTYSDDVAAFEALADDLGYVIQTVDSGIYFGTDEDDLFLFDFETLKADSVSNVTINDLSDTDVLYFGEGFVEGVKGQEDNNTLEFFITEVNGNAVLQVENTAFGSQTDDFVEITLTGVAAADVSFEDGAFFLA